MSDRTLTATVRLIASVLLICFIVGQVTNIPTIAAVFISAGVLIITFALLERYT